MAVGYDAVGLIRQACATANIAKGEDLKRALYTIKNYKGASSDISINEKGSSPQYEHMYQLRNGKFILVNSDS